MSAPEPWHIEEGGTNFIGNALGVEVLDREGFPIAELRFRPILSCWQERYPDMRHWAEGAGDGRTQIERRAGEVIANAHLIAAAPDLCEALEGLKSLVVDYLLPALSSGRKPDVVDIIAFDATTHKVDSALAKARGES